MEKKFGLRYSIVRGLNIVHLEKWFATDYDRERFIDKQLDKDIEFEIEAFCQ